MATTTESQRDPVRGPRRSYGRAIPLALLAGLAGLGVGRFVSYDGGGGSPPPVAVAASSPKARLAGLERAAALRPDDPRAWQELGSTYVRLAIATGDPTYFSGAERALARARELDPTSPVTLVAEGTFALTLHQFAEALRLGEEAEEIDPFNPEAKAVRVDALIELGRYDDAADTLQDLLDLRPGLAALTRVSYLRQLSGDLDGALAAMQQARAAGSQGFESAVATALQGEIHLLQGDLDLARRAFDASLRQSPGLVGGELGRARVLEATGQRAEAIQTLDAAVEAIGSPALAVLLGELLEAEGDVSGAETAYETARQVYRDEVAAGAIVDLELAFLEADHGSPTTALQSARLAYAARPNIYTSDAMAWALYRSGRATEAVPFAEESLRRGTTDPALRTHAAAVFVASGRTDDARAALAGPAAIGGYMPPSLRATASDLGRTLGIEVPDHWRSDPVP